MSILDKIDPFITAPHSIFDAWNTLAINWLKIKSPFKIHHTISPGQIALPKISIFYSTARPKSLWRTLSKIRRLITKSSNYYRNHPQTRRPNLQGSTDVCSAFSRSSRYKTMENICRHRTSFCFENKNRISLILLLLPRLIFMKTSWLGNDFRIIRLQGAAITNMV